MKNNIICIEKETYDARIFQNMDATIKTNFFSQMLPVEAPATVELFRHIVSLAV